MYVCSLLSVKNWFTVPYPQKLGRELSQPDLVTRTFLLATMYQILIERHDTQEVVRDLHNLVVELAGRIDQNFQISQEQKARMFILHCSLFVSSQPLADESSNHRG
jgi:hypothetical protein